MFKPHWVSYFWRLLYMIKLSFPHNLLPVCVLWSEILGVQLSNAMSSYLSLAWRFVLKTLLFDSKWVRLVKNLMIIFKFSSVNVSQSMLAKLVSKLVMPVGNYTVWNMESNLMVKCHQTKPLEVEMILSTLSSVKLEEGNMSRELFSPTLNQQ